MPSLFSSNSGLSVSVEDVEGSIVATLTRPSSLRFWYGASIAEFAGASAEQIVGQLTLNCFVLTSIAARLPRGSKR